MSWIPKNLPSGWVVAKIEDIVEVIRGGSPRPKGDPRYFGGEIPWIMIADVTRSHGRYISKTRDTVTEAGSLKSRYLKSGTLILSNSGTVCVPKILAVDGCIHDGFVGFPNLPSEIDIFYLYEFFYFIRPKIIEKYKQGVTQVNLNISIVRDIEIPLPPLNEQKRIVAKIEALQERSQRVKAELVAIRPLLNKFRQSVLAAAFRGDLTKDWREKNPDIEPASVLLERIKIERRRRWEEAELEKMKAAGKTPKDDKWKHKYNEPEPVNSDNLPQLPDGWCWASFTQISDRVTVGHVGSMKNEYRQKGIPFLRSQNVRENRFDSEGLTFISEDFHHKLIKSSLQPGDLVVVRSGNVGVSCVIPEYLKEANCSDLVIVKQPKGILAEYGAFYMNSVAKSDVTARKVGVALTHFNTKSMAEMSIPFPYIEEQKEIVNRIDKLFKIADNIEHLYQQTETDLETLNQSILAKAFRGELVPQNPNDEPASVLLERIRKERETDSKPAKQTRQKPPKTDNYKSTQLTLEGIE